jgi:hypothetical protein
MDKDETVFKMNKDEKIFRIDKSRILRFQNYNNGKIHIHDDKNSLVFEHKLSVFQLAIEEFTRNQWRYPTNATVMIPGENDSADFIIKRRTKGWSLQLVQKDKTKANIILGDATVSFLDDFIHNM